MKKFNLIGLWPLIPVLAGFYIPIGLVAIQDGFLESSSALSDGLFSSLPVILTTLRLAFFAALFATLLGLLDAVFLAGTRGPARALIVILLLAIFLIPPSAFASAVQSVIGSSSLRATVRDELGAVLMLVFRWAPVACAMLLGAAALWPADQERALRGLPPWVALSTRARGLSRQALRCAGLLMLLLIPASELPSYAGVETISQRVHARLTVGAAVEGWLLAFAMLIPLAVTLFFLFPRLHDSSRAPRDQSITGLPRLAHVDLFLVIRSVPALALIFILMSAAWPSASEVATARSEILESILGICIEAPRAIVVSIFVVICGWRLADGGSRWGLLLLGLPTVMPGSLGALALLQSTRSLVPAYLDEIPLLLSIAQLCKLGAIGAAAGFIATRVMPLAERNSSLLLDPSAGRWKVRFPRALPVLIPAVVVCVGLVLGEVEATLVLAPPGHPAPALELHQLLHFRNDEQAARIALVLAMLGGLLATALVAPVVRRRK